jgi:poly(3-hydroxybutyrate) depolymerase
MAALFVEGEKDDITGLGQVTALGRKLTGIEDQSYIRVKGAGHTGVFRGDNFLTHVCKPVSDFMRAHDRMPSAPTPKFLPVPNPEGWGLGQAA